MMLMSGLGLLAATIPLPNAMAGPSPHPDAPPGGAPAYLFQDDFDGPAGSAPNPGNWTIQNWQDDVWPPVESQYRDDRRNVFLDGNSNLVLLATREDDQYFSGKVRGNWRVPMGYTWEARAKLDCLTSGAWPAYWAVNEDPLPDGEVDIFEFYGNRTWAPGTTRHRTGRPGKASRLPG
jgi:hypothetical protein